jgi:hypothetical protein
MLRGVSRDAALLVSVIAIGAALFVLHAALLLRALTARQLSPWLRALALVPVVTPVAGWRAGARGLCVAWGTCGLLYAALRLFAR